MLWEYLLQWKAWFVFVGHLKSFVQVNIANVYWQSINKIKIIYSSACSETW